MFVLSMIDVLSISACGCTFVQYSAETRTDYKRKKLSTYQQCLSRLIDGGLKSSLFKFSKIRCGCVCAFLKILKLIFWNLSKREYRFLYWSWSIKIFWKPLCANIVKIFITRKPKSHCTDLPHLKTFQIINEFSFLYRNIYTSRYNVQCIVSV